MIKKFLVLLLVTVVLNAGTINAIAVIVNNNIITLYDIDQIVDKKKLSQHQAIRILINDLLYKEELKKLNISAEPKEVSMYIHKLAQANNMSIVELRAKANEQKDNNKTFEENIKQQLLYRKLIEKIAKGKTQRPTDSDIKLFYDTNIDNFRINKYSIKVLPFQKVKNKIFNIIVNKREQKYVRSYFESLKITADIKILR
ncbi:Possible periplasmic protein [hydrothermal vent metagenome]|uniref:Possible periplasmic protein n=1 Tax=hydrothermal vent metagenome TaxID=652676 RepID=A0A3B1E659_9ZZZZ